MDMDKRKTFLSQAFERRFGSKPTLWTRAPGRVDLMGSHTDYNLGYVMTMTINRDTWVASVPRMDRKVNIYSLDMKSGAELSLDDLSKDEEGSWTNYVRAIAKYLLEAGYELKGFNGLVQSTVPFSAGLSSSAALEMAIAMAFQAVSGFKMNPVEMALLGQKAENQYIGINSGILDQYSSVMGEEGKTVLLDCRALTHTMVNIAPDLQVVICDTKAKRNLVDSEYDDRRHECEAGVEILKRAIPQLQPCEMFPWLNLRQSRPRCQR